MTQQIGNALDRIFDALAAGDLEAAGACLTDDGRVWHCFDRIAHDRASAMKDWEGFVTHFPERRFSEIRRQATPDGFVQQHVLTVQAANSKRMAWPVCVIVRMDGDRIALLEEYIDRAGTYLPTD